MLAQFPLDQISIVKSCVLKCFSRIDHTMAALSPYRQRIRGMYLPLATLTYDLR